MTLVELLVVLGIIGLILGVSVPGLAGYAQRVRLKATTRQIVGLLSFARSIAISSHEDHAVLVDTEHQELRVMNLASEETLDHKVRLPSSVAVEVLVGGEPAAQPRVVFRPTGSLTDRTTSLTLTDRDKQQTITVSGITGAVSVD